MKNHSGMKEVYHSLVDNLGSFVRHPIMSSMIFAGVLLPLEYGIALGADRQTQHNKTQIYSNQPSTNVFLDGATLANYQFDVFMDEKGPAPLSGCIFKTSNDSLAMKYSVVNDPVQYLGRVIGNKENDDGTKRVAKDVLARGGLVQDSSSIKKLEDALRDGFIYSEELDGVLPGGYIVNPKTGDWEYCKKGSSVIKYLRLVKGKSPDYSAGEMIPSLFGSTSKTELERRLREEVTGPDSTQEVAAGVAGAIKDEKSWIGKHWYLIPLGVIVAGGIGYWIASGHNEEETRVSGGEIDGNGWGHQ
ncbi:MAG: hypothetical protein V1663_02775 [archaeon]